MYLSKLAKLWRYCILMPTNEGCDRDGGKCKLASTDMEDLTKKLTKSCTKHLVNR